RGADPRALLDCLRASNSVELTVNDGPVTIGPDDVLVTEVPRTGWVVESQRGVTIALDTEITPELAAEGIARDVVRVVQQARREAGLDVADRIGLSIAGPPAVLAIVRIHKEFIAHEALATSVAVMDELSEGFSGAVGAAEDIAVHVVKA
ncbi:MAG: DUF5915 domain-containing protein, partial [Actinobacteria bacterium]|nr:DUF5915 domain-containing protein [Actinomycetota bacterium]